MAINFMDKHAAKVDERFAAGSITQQITNQDYDFVGVKTVKVHSVPTVALNNYMSSGSNRYGSPSELGDDVQELTLTQDKSFTFTVDKGNSEADSALNAGKALKREVDEVIVPTVDMYRLAVMAAGAGKCSYGAISKSNAYETLLGSNGTLDDAKVPAAGRSCVVSTDFYTKLKLDSNFIKAGDMGQRVTLNGQLGEADGLPIIRSYGRLPKNVAYMIVHNSACCAPHKLSQYRTHQDPPGISGVLAEGRDIYDAFVLDQKANGIAVHRTALGDLTVTNEAGESGKTKFTVVSGDKEEGVSMGTLVYIIATNPTAPALGADISNIDNFPELTLDSDISAESGNKYIIALKDQNGKCIATSGAATACTIGA